MKVKYRSNNSGGSWWLTDEDWYALERGGWKVEWEAGTENLFKDKDGRFLGALAVCAAREGLPYLAAVKEWEEITGKSALEPGCACCGQPHYFTEYDENGKWVNSGPTFNTEGSY